MERTQVQSQDSGSTVARGLFEAEDDGFMARDRSREAVDEPQASGGRYEDRLARLMRLLNR